jgi:hypothetical protein
VRHVLPWAHDRGKGREEEYRPECPPAYRLISYCLGRRSVILHGRDQGVGCAHLRSPPLITRMFTSDMRDLPVCSAGTCSDMRAGCKGTRPAESAGKCMAMRRGGPASRGARLVWGEGRAEAQKHLQDDQLARLERQNREQGKANHKAGKGAKVAGTEYEETVPSAHCDPSR